jgi:hypothetical protein
MIRHWIVVDVDVAGSELRRILLNLSFLLVPFQHADLLRHLSSDHGQDSLWASLTVALHGGIGILSKGPEPFHR